MESGKHDGLMANENSHYRRLVLAQEFVSAEENENAASELDMETIEHSVGNGETKKNEKRE